MVTDAAFWDGAAEKYAQSPIKNMDGYNQTLDLTRAYLGPTSRVFEVGCGTSNTAVNLSGDAGHILATDISPNMIDIGQRRVEEAGVTNVEPRVGTLFDAQFDTQTFDAILAFNFIHLVRDPLALIRRAYDRLEPGGVLISKSGCMKNWFVVMKGLIWVMQKVGKAPYVASFSVDELDQFHRDAGFEIVETRTFGKHPPSRFIVARKPL